MRLIPISAITIPTTRQRIEHPITSHTELLNSIWHGPVGLQNPPVVRPLEGGYLLVSGERRLRAIRDIYLYNGLLRYAGETLPSGMIPVTLTSELSEVDAWEVELDENLRRLDMTWQEQVNAIAQLAKLREAQGKGGVASELTTKLDLSPSRVNNILRDALLIDRHLDDPTIAKADSQKEALRLIRVKAQREESEKFATLPHARSKHTILLGDARTLLANMPPLGARVILTDPPYGINAHTFGNSGEATVATHAYEDSPEAAISLIRDMAPLFLKHTLPEAHLYLFCDFRRFLTIADILEGEWKVFPTPLIWYKPTGFRTPWVGKGPQRKYECILYAVRGDYEVRVTRGDVISQGMTEDLPEGITHNARKPVALYTDLLTRSISPGDLILDPFAGSGPIFPAASALSCRAIGIELLPEFAGECLRRIAEGEKCL